MGVVIPLIFPKVPPIFPNVILRLPQEHPLPLDTPLPIRPTIKHTKSELRMQETPGDSTKNVCQARIYGIKNRWSTFGWMVFCGFLMDFWW